MASYLVLSPQSKLEHVQMSYHKYLVLLPQTQLKYVPMSRHKHSVLLPETWVEIVPTYLVCSYRILLPVTRVKNVPISQQKWSNGFALTNVKTLSQSGVSGLAAVVDSCEGTIIPSSSYVPAGLHTRKNANIFGLAAVSLSSSKGDTAFSCGMKTENNMSPMTFLLTHLRNKLCAQHTQESLICTQSAWKLNLNVEVLNKKWKGAHTALTLDWFNIRLEHSGEKDAAIFHSFPQIWFDWILTGIQICELVLYVWEGLASWINFSKLVVTSVLAAQCGKTQQLVFCLDCTVPFCVCSEQRWGAETRFWRNLTQTEVAREWSWEGPSWPRASLNLYVHFSLQQHEFRESHGNRWREGERLDWSVLSVGN